MSGLSFGNGDQRHGGVRQPALLKFIRLIAFHGVAVQGTHLDWTLPVEQRIDYLVAQATLDEKIAQLTNDAPSMPRFGIPSYNWLNDDVHAVQQPHTTVFPDGTSL